MRILCSNLNIFDCANNLIVKIKHSWMRIETSNIFKKEKNLYFLCFIFTILWTLLLDTDTIDKIIILVN